MNKRLFIFLSLVVVLSLALAACGGGDDDDAGDPTQVVKDLMKAIENKQFDKIPDYACAAQKEEVAETFDIGTAIASSLGGEDVDPEKVLDAMTFKVSNLEVTEKSKSGDKAVVHVKARLEMSVDPEKFKELVRELLEAQGLGDIPDSLLDQQVGPILEQFEDFGEDIDQDFEVVEEEGKWLICED